MTDDLAIRDPSEVPESLQDGLADAYWALLAHKTLKEAEAALLERWSWVEAVKFVYDGNHHYILNVIPRMSLRMIKLTFSVDGSGKVIDYEAPPRSE